MRKNAPHTFHHRTPFLRMVVPSPRRLFVCGSQCAMLPSLFVWLESCERQAGRVRHERRSIQSKCHHGLPQRLTFLPDGKAAQCRVMEKTVCRCDALGNECGI